MIAGTRSCSSCRLTKYGFPRTSMPAARFRQWHFNRRARNSRLHLHRVVSPFHLPLFCLFVVILRRLAALLYEFTCRAANAHRTRCGCRCTWNCSRINTHRSRSRLLTRVRAQQFNGCRYSFTHHSECHTGVDDH